MKEHLEQKWYVRTRGETRGPFPAGQISRYVLLGRISKDDAVSPDKAEWHRLSDFPELIPEVMREAAEHPEDPEAVAHLEAARRWADELRSPHGAAEPAKQKPARWKGYLTVIVIVAAVTALPFLLPRQSGVSEPQCESPPAPGVVWRDCRLAASQLANASLAGAVLRSADLRDSVLRAADLRGVDAAYADLSLANLRGATLSGATLTGVNLHGADLVNADLRNADLSYADLSGADLDGVDLSGARLDYAVWGDGLICLPGSVGECLLGRETGG